MDDIVNFFPNFMHNMYSLVKGEVERSSKISSVFESEYSFASKVLNNLKRRYEFEIFAHKLLERGIRKLKTIKF